MKSLKLPKSTFAFEKIITKRYYYVDKTPLIHKMLTDEDGYCFLSRPRRFGKSLLIDTIKCLFEGKKELFKNLYIYDKWDFEENTHPVIRIDLSDGEYNEDGGLKVALNGLMDDIEDEHQISIKNPSNYIIRLKQIIKKLYHKHNKKVVVLIDEYDTPILDSFTVNQDIAESNRYLLSKFFGVLKTNKDYIRFVFITGISMFPKTNMTTGLNNVTDISLDPEYSTICGFTEKELKSVFAPELQSLKDISFERIKNYYNGYNWSGDKQNKVYNPFGIVNLFSKKKVSPRWFSTCTPNFLYKMLKENYIAPLKIANNEWQDEEKLNCLDISNPDLYSLLFQMGVLTIVDEKYDDNSRTLFLLDYPNFEVKSSFTIGAMFYYLSSAKYSLLPSKAKTLVELLEQNDFSKFQQTLHSLFADIPFPWNKNPKDADYEYTEGFFASLIYTSFIAIGVKVNKESCSYLGKSDIEIELGNQVFIFELKILRDKDIEKSLDKALEQIEHKGYGSPHSYGNKKVFSIAISLDNKKRNIVGLKHLLIFDGSQKL